LIIFGRKIVFDGGKSTGGGVVDEKTLKITRYEFPQVSGLFSVGQKNNVFGVMRNNHNVLGDTKKSKGGKWNYPMSWNYQEIKKFISHLWKLERNSTR